LCRLGGQNRGVEFRMADAGIWTEPVWYRDVRGCAGSGGGKDWLNGEVTSMFGIYSKLWFADRV
jgi:hypothetical protein